MYRFRFIKIILTALLFRSRRLLDDFEINFWALPFVDTDFSRLFTQTYALYMGLGRWHFVFNSEFRSVAIKKRWIPVTTAETIVYKRSIKAFSCVTLRTKLLCWDEKRFYLEQSFWVKGEVYASAYLQGLIRSPSGHLKPTEVFPAIGLSVESPPAPVQIESWKLLL